MGTEQSKVTVQGTVQNHPKVNWLPPGTYRLMAAMHEVFASCLLTAPPH